MQAVFRKYPDTGPFFVALQKTVPRFEGKWHYHDAFELAYIVRSRGLRYVGDSIEPLRTGDLILVGPRIPHSNVSAPELDNQPHTFVVVHFTRDILPHGDLQHADLTDLSRLLSDADHGLLFSGPTRRRVVPILRRLPQLRPLPRLSAFLTVLDILGRAPASDRRRLSITRIPTHSGADAPTGAISAGALEDVCRQLERNTHRPVSALQMARTAAMSPATFARAFRRTTGMSFSRYVGEIRLRRASQMLIEGDMPITEIAVAAGFPTLSYFTRRFTQARGMSPRQYRQRMRSAGPRAG